MLGLWCLLVFQALVYPAVADDFDESKIRFFLYKRGSEDNPSEIRRDEDGWEQSDIDPKLATVMFIHGYGGGHLKPPAQSIKNAVLSVYDANVILVNYGPYSFPYLNLFAKSRSIAKTCAGLINSFIQLGKIDISNFTLIGHSFGSHISGFTANSVNNKIPRIIGLDPAGPYFKDAAPEDRLSADDADYVECIHTSPVLGINKAICTVDFFPNGGTLQPACANTDDNEILFGTCSHQVAVDYYAEAIKSPESFPASICNSDIEAKSLAREKSCTVSTGVFMGNAFNRPQPGSYFVEIPS